MAQVAKYRLSGETVMLAVRRGVAERFIRLRQIRQQPTYICG